jgi:pyruvate dehydrogenase E2 component (dihydrolipoamide acetyltransferase)
VPSLFDGVIKDVRVHVGDKVSAGAPIVVMEIPESPTLEASLPTGGEYPLPASAPGPTPVAPASLRPEYVPAPPSHPGEPADLRLPLGEGQLGMPPVPPRRAQPLPSPTTAVSSGPAQAPSHASPAIRRLAREMGVDVAAVKGTGPHARIRQEDLRAHVAQRLNHPAQSTPVPLPDFAQFGLIETRPLSRIQRLSAAHLQQVWTQVPQVTQLGEADITELEAFRKAEVEAAQRRGVRLTLLAFVMKAVVRTLKGHPTCNSSLDALGENLILKRYFHIAFAVDTAEGLLVPVVRDVDRKGILDLATELAELSSRARQKKLTPSDLQGATFTISSLGGIGGTGFCPIVNAPEVAILGVSRASLRPEWVENRFEPRLFLPLALSYDHRVVDGAEGARFMVDLCRELTDIRRLLL